MTEVPRSMLREFSRVAFDPSLPRLQKAIYRSLVIGVLARKSKDEIIGSQEIAQEIALGLDVTSVPTLLVGSALKALAHDGVVKAKKAQWRVLTPPVLPDEGPMETIHRGFLSRLESDFGSLDKYQKEVALGALDAVLVALVADMGARARAVLSREPVQAIEDVSVPKIVRTKFGLFKDVAIDRLDLLQGATLGAIYSHFGSLDHEDLTALGELVHIAVMCRVLVAEPDLLTLRAATFKGARLILDTNVLFALLCKGSLQHRVTCGLLESARKLGVKLVVQDVSLEEFSRAITKDTVRFRAQQGTYLDVDFASRDLPSTYYRFKSEYGDWYGLLAAIRAAVSNLEKAYGIRTITRAETDLPPRMVEVASRFIQSAAAKKDRIKDTDAIEHDAKSLVITYESRKDAEEFTLRQTWFLTRDLGLLTADEGYARYRQSIAPAAIGYDLLSELISPFLSAEMRSDFTTVLGQVLAWRVASINEDLVWNFIAYTLDQSGVEADANLVGRITSEAHATRIMQKLSAGELPAVLKDLKESVERAYPADSILRKKEKTIKRLVSLIKGSSSETVLAVQTQSSGIARLVSIIDEKLRLMIHSEDCPADEDEVQVGLNSLLRVFDYRVSWNRSSVQFSERMSIPDFVVSLSKVDVPIEVKLVSSSKRKTAIIEEMAADLLQYGSKWKSVVFVVYDCGCIVDKGQFCEDFERQGAIMVIIKQ